jgi:hypothetical protein
MINPILEYTFNRVEIDSGVQGAAIQVKSVIDMNMVA